MDLSIIIVNWNTNSLLQKCLGSIIAFTHDIKYELIVIDNGSSDGSVEIVKSMFPSVILIQNEKNVGFASGVNQGLKIANGGSVLLLNSDTFIKENSFAPMIELLSKQKHIGAMTCRVLYPGGRSQSAYCRFPNLPGMIYEVISMFKSVSHFKIFNQYDVTQWDYSVSKELRDGLWPGGGCLMIKSEVIRKVGSLDENFGYAYLEDADLCYRIKNAGYSFYYLAKATIYHHHSYSVSKSSQEFKDILTLNLQQNRYYFFKKHYSANHLLMLKLLDIFKNVLVESCLLLMYFFNLKNKEMHKKKIKLYSKLITGCFVKHQIE
jgi:GT2 family glycosyltransferase